VTVAQLKWLEKPDFHNRRSKRSGDLRKEAKTSICLKGRTLYDLSCLSGRFCRLPFSAGNASLAYGYENQAFQATD